MTFLVLFLLPSDLDSKHHVKKMVSQQRSWTSGLGGDDVFKRLQRTWVESRGLQKTAGRKAHGLPTHQSDQLTFRCFPSKTLSPPSFPLYLVGRWGRRPCWRTRSEEPRCWLLGGSEEGPVGLRMRYFCEEKAF